MTILAAIGEERRSNDVVSVGYDLASAYDDSLTIVHVVPQGEFEDHRDEIMQLPDFSDLSLTQKEESAAQFAETVAKETLDDFDSEVISTVGRIGNPVERILEVADETDPRYLVIGGRRRSPTGKAIFGSNTQSILLQSERPVVTVMME